MRDQPTGEQLLETARDVLREEVLPHLPANRRHAALMIANAMAIARRELQSGEEAERRELEALRNLLSMRPSDQGAAGTSLHDALVDCNRALCRLIREGQADTGSAGEAVKKHLLAATRHRVTISNPKYLGA